MLLIITKNTIFVDNKQQIMKLLVLGDGLLGSEIIKQTGWEYLSMNKDGIDVVNEFQELCVMIDDIIPDVIVNCIGYTDTYSQERQKHWEINYRFVTNLVDFCEERSIKLVHISTDYIYANSKNNKTENDIPVHQETWYSYTKLISDAYVQLRIDNYLLVRCSFKPKPFPYEKAFGNVKGNFDYVDVIAGQIIDLIKEDRSGIWNIGTKFKSIYDLAKQTRPDIGEWYNDKLPTIEMDLTKFNSRLP
jgi:dTDP-4-dehydrorhamnose reductase